MGSGSDSNDEDLVAGRTNRMERRTILWADAAPGEPDFNGPAILIVEVAKDLEDSEWDNSDYDDYWAYIPANQVHGIMATAWSGGSIADDPDDLAGDPGGIGVIGRGGRNEGTGVQGLGGGINGPLPTSGARGIGVHGIGSSNHHTPPSNTFLGAGLVGQGGRQSTENNLSRLPHSAGVIGIGGGNGEGLNGYSFDALQLQTLAETGGAGVYGQGAESTITTVVSPQTNTPVASGPPGPGAGVIGRGGTATSPDPSSGAGVVGLAGGVPAIPQASQIDGIGVFGQGNRGVTGRGTTIGVAGHSDGIGVSGTTDTGEGVHGSAGAGRGGVFGSKKSAQLRLIPNETTVALPDSKLSTPVELTKTGIPQSLPKAGESGDIVAIDVVTPPSTSDSSQTNTCTLWFCVRSATKTHPAVWSQILLGGFVDGQV